MAAGTSQTDNEAHPRRTRSARSWQSNGLSGKNSEKKVTSNLQNKTGSALIEAPGPDSHWLRAFLISPICASSSPPACEPKINLSTPCWRTHGRVLLSVFYFQRVKAESMDSLTSSSHPLLTSLMGGTELGRRPTQIQESVLLLTWSECVGTSCHR